LAAFRYDQLGEIAARLGRSDIVGTTRRVADLSRGMYYHSLAQEQRAGGSYALALEAEYCGTAATYFARAGEHGLAQQARNCEARAQSDLDQFNRDLEAAVEAERAQKLLEEEAARQAAEAERRRKEEERRWREAAARAREAYGLERSTDAFSETASDRRARDAENAAAYEAHGLDDATDGFADAARSADAANRHGLGDVGPDAFATAAQSPHAEDLFYPLGAAGEPPLPQSGLRDSLRERLMRNASGDGAGEAASAGDAAITADETDAFAAAAGGEGAASSSDDSVATPRARSALDEIYEGLPESMKSGRLPPGMPLQ
jgi:hypothetical protein